MTGRIAIDFGTANTVIASWDTVRRQGVSYPLGEYSGTIELRNEPVPLIPSLIYYGTNGKNYFGAEVTQRNLLSSTRSFQWMKRYILNFSNSRRKIDEQNISHSQAASDFLSKIFERIKLELAVSENEDIAMTVPVESFSHYENWLTGIANKAGLQKVRFIDEPSAAALGYSTRLFADESCLVFDFGAGSLDLSIVRQERDPAQGMQHCRVLSKSGLDLGGSIIDEWIYQEVLAINGLEDGDREVQQVSRQLLGECTALKERLCFEDNSELTVVNHLSGSLIKAEFSRKDLIALLENRGVYRLVDSTIDQAMNEAAKRGCSKESITAVLMVGGSSLIPGIEEILNTKFTADKVKSRHPLDAIARGAAAFIAGGTVEDFVQHDYAIRIKNTNTQDYEFKNLVQSGSHYPSNGPLAKVTVKAMYSGQDEFMLQIYERKHRKAASLSELELVFDENGNVRLKRLSKTDLNQRNQFWLNEKSPSMLTANPPAQEGEERFELAFAVDKNRRLVVTSKDLRTDKLIHQDFPVVKLS